MKRMFIVVFLLSGFGFIYYGIKAILGALMIGVGPTTEEEKVADKKLANQIYDESITRGDGWAIANFYRSDTEDLSEQGRSLGRLMALVGIIAVCCGVVIVYGWWLLIM